MSPVQQSETASVQAASNGATSYQSSMPQQDSDSERSVSAGSPSGAVDEGSVADPIIDFIQKNPLLASAAALALGAAIVMAVRSRSAANNTFDRRAMRAARSMEKTIAREFRAARGSNIADQLGKIGESLGSAVGNVDLQKLMDAGRGYVEAARNRIKV